MDVPNPYTLKTIDFVGGTTEELVFHGYFWRNKKPHDLTGCTANFAIINYVNKHGEPVVSKAMTVEKDPVLDDDDIQNLVRVTLEPEDTVNLPAGKYIYQISLRGAKGEIEIPKQGIMYLFHNINRDFIK